MLLSVSCRECGNKPRPDARFCDQCGVQISAVPDADHSEPASVPKALNMSTSLLHSDFAVVFERMREAKRTSKSLAIFFRAYATQEQKQTMDMKKALTSFSCNEPESRTLVEFISQMNANLEKQGRLSLMFSNCVNDEVAQNLNQLRLQLKQHQKAAVDSYNKALKLLAASDSTIQKCRDRIARLEKQSATPSSSSNLISAARAAVGPAPTLPMLKAELDKALLGRETNVQGLTATRAAILRDWEVMEQSRLATIVDCIERGLSLSGSLLRQKVAFNYDLLLKLKSVSAHDDIDYWVQKHAIPSTRPVDVLPEHNDTIEVGVVEPSAPEKPWHIPTGSAKLIFDWVPGTESKQWPLLSPTIAEAKLLALCFCYRIADAEQQRYCRRDLRVLLGVRESVLDTSLTAINRIEGDARHVLQDSSLSLDQRRLICLIVAGQLTDESSLQTLQSILEAGGSSERLNELDLTSLKALDIRAPFSSSHSLMLYRALFAAVVEDGGVEYLSEPINSDTATPTISEDWQTIIQHLETFRHDRNISDSDHAAVWLHCLRYDILALLSDPRPDRKLDIADVTSETTVAALDKCAKACMAISEPTPILMAVIDDFKEWLNAILRRYFFLSPSTMLLTRSLFLLFGGESSSLRQMIRDSSEDFYHEARAQTPVLCKEFVQIISSEMELPESVQNDAALQADFELLRDQIRSQIWEDVHKQIAARPGVWIQTLELVHIDQLWNRDHAERVAHEQIGLWLEDFEVRMAEKIEKMLLVDPRTPISAETPFSSSVIDLFSALNAIVDVFERFHSGMDRMQIAIGENVVSSLMSVITSSIRFYSNAIPSSSRPIVSETKAKAELRRNQADCDVLISQAAAKFNTKAKILNLKKTVKKLANRTTDNNHQPEPVQNVVPLPVATSTRSIPELIVMLNNCRQAIIQLDHIVRRMKPFSGNVTPNVAVYQHLDTSCSELAQLIADRLVFHDLQQLFATIYNPSPSNENSFANVLLRILDDSMANIFSSLHDDLFTTAAMFQKIVTAVFSSVLTAFLWIVSAGAGDRNYQDIDYSLLTDDFNSIQTLFESELPDDAKKLMDPITSHLELMALSSNEIIEEICNSRLTRINAALVLTRRTDQIAMSWLKSQSKLIYK